MGRWADHPAAAWALAAVALGLAALGARPYAGSWNDGSRLAAVESLLGRGTLAIDDSIFVRPPQHLLDAGLAPYPAESPHLLTFGTLDKLYIHGRYYSDKPLLISVLMAAVYRPLVWLGAPLPSERPDVFIWVMTVLTSGVGYAAAVGCLWALGQRVGLAARWRLVWLAAFAVATFALAYTRHVNNHAMHLGVLAGVCLLLARVAGATRTPWASLAGLGTLAGLGFNLDFGSGPPLVAAVFLALWWRTRRPVALLVYTLAALPWAVAGLALNYAIGGVLKPPNMVPEYFAWPGSPFDPTNLTGFVHKGPLGQLVYALSLLVGKHGYLNHNLPILLAATVGWGVFRRPFAGRVELLAMLGWCVAAWLLYGFLSNNQGGKCCSIRWFVPFLAPGFWLLAVMLRDRPRLRADFAVLSLWGGVLGALMWWKGPWTMRMIPLMWPVVGCALLSWAAVAYHRWRADGINTPKRSIDGITGFTRWLVKSSSSR